jgi:FkbM family methyltransferase
VKARRAQVFERLGMSRYSWPALNGLDRKLAAFLPCEGTFLEVGGNDGYSQSNTYHLEKWLGWSGVLIEPIPELSARSRRVRKRSVCYNLACVAPEHAGRPVQVLNRDLTSVALGQQAPAAETARLGRVHRGEIVNVGTATVSHVIDHSRIADVTFMSVDVEGAEIALLSGLDLERHTPEFLLVETDRPEAVHAVLETMDLVDQLSHHDYLFRRKDPVATV